jgi:hypothetical protein
VGGTSWLKIPIRRSGMAQWICKRLWGRGLIGGGVRFGERAESTLYCSVCGEGCSGGVQSGGAGVDSDASFRDTSGLLVDVSSESRES